MIHAMSLLRTELTVDMVMRLAACKVDVVMIIAIKMQLRAFTKEVTNRKAIKLVYCRQSMN